MTNAQKRLDEVMAELEHAKTAHAHEYREHRNGNNSARFAELEKTVEDWKHEVKTETESTCDPEEN